MPLRRFSPGLKAQFAFGMVFLFVQPDASAADISAQQIGGVIIPQAFSQALQDGMSVPLYIHLAGSQGRQDDQRIGSAFIWLDDGQLRIRKIQLEESEDNASVSEQTRQQLMALANAPFNEALTIPLTDNAQLDLSLRQLLLSLFINDDISPTSSAWAGDIPENSRARGRRCFFITIPSRNKAGWLPLLVHQRD